MGNDCIRRWIIAKFVTGQPLTAEQRHGVWDAVVWASWYELRMQREHLPFRLAAMGAFIAEVTRDKTLLGAALEELRRIALEVPPAGLRKLANALPNAGVGSEVIALRQEFLDRLPAPPVPVSNPTRLPARATQPSAFREARSAPMRALPPVAATTPITSNRSEPLAADEQAAFCARVKRVWWLLDPKREAQHRADMERACGEPATEDGTAALVALAGAVARSAVTREEYGARLKDADLDDAAELAALAARHSGAGVNTRYAVLLRASLGLHRRILDHKAFGAEVEARFPGDSNRQIWPDLAAAVAAGLAAERHDGADAAQEAEAWVQFWATRAALLDDAGRFRLLEEVEKHGVRDSLALARLRGAGASSGGKSGESEGPLAFLDERRREELIRAALESRLSDVKTMLHQARAPLLASLSRLLADPSFHEELPPRRALRLSSSRGDADAMASARKLLASTSFDDRRRALALFDDALRATTHPDWVPLAREWKLYAQARALGPASVVAEWERDRREWEREPRNRRQSWEEIWNLAVYYLKSGHPARALEVLRPGVEALAAPFAHLTFALYCAVQILEREQAGPLAEPARSFGIAHLTKYPAATGYLTWLLLVAESGVQLDPLEEASVLGAFARIITQSIVFLKPEQKHDDAEIERFGSALRELNAEASWRLWINDYAERHVWAVRPWILLSETCERAGDLDRAQAALQQILEVEIGTLERISRERGDPARGDAARSRARSCLIRLFEFCRRHNRSAEARALFETFIVCVRSVQSGSQR